MRDFKHGFRGNSSMKIGRNKMLVISSTFLGVYIVRDFRHDFRGNNLADTKYGLVNDL